MEDEAEFGAVNGKNGKKRILASDEAQAAKNRQRRYREPRPLRIQVLLKQACRFNGRLDGTPGLTRNALAKEIGINPSYLTRILNLLNLAPKIQRRIVAMPPSAKQGPITECRIKHLARIQNHNLQIKEFERLLSLNGDRPQVLSKRAIDNTAYML